jgi:linoleoyl-CoA desaturase
MKPRQNRFTIDLTFTSDNEFKRVLHERVNEWFVKNGRSKTDNPRMYIKTILTLAGFIGVYLLLLLFVQSAWQAVLCCVVLSLLVAGIGFNIQHDGGHKAISRHNWINKAMSLSLDAIGGSSYFWFWKHVVLHHRFVNIAGYDSDIDLAMGRLSPHKKYYPVFRLQHFYLWLFYGLLVLNWHLVADFKVLITGRVGSHQIPRPRGWDLVTFILGKLVFLSLTFGIPLLFHPVLNVLLCYLLIVFIAGILLSVVFQLAHCVQGTEFPQPYAGTHKMKSSWELHQMHESIDFARKNKVLTWLLGGLNFQKEHHLFPTISHVYYPAISRIVEETCHQFGISYTEYRTFWSALASHYRWLRQMSRKNA